MNNKKKLKDLIKTYNEVGGLDSYQGTVVWALLKLMKDGISKSTSSGDIALLFTDHCVEIAKHNDETGNFTTIAYLSLTIL